MSSAEVLRHLHCIVCNTIYDGAVHKPVIVAPCAHTACARCIDALIRETINETDGQSDIIQCPVCHNPVHFSQASVNHVLLDIVMNFDQSENDHISQSNGQFGADPNNQIESCQLCLADEIDEPSVIHCYDCVMNLCDDHARIHAKRKDNVSHRTQNIDPNDINVMQSINQSLGSRPLNRCSKHPANQFEYYCSSCDTLICVRCAVVDHQSHEKHELTLEWLNKQPEFQTIQRLNDELITRSNTCVQKIQDQLYHNQGHEQHAIQSIEQTITHIAETFRAALNHQLHSLSQHVRSVTAHRAAELNERWQTIDQTKQTIDSVGHSVQHMVDNQDFAGFYQSKADIQSSLQQLDVTVKSIDQAVDQASQHPAFVPATVILPIQPAVDAMVQAVNHWFSTMQHQGTIQSQYPPAEQSVNQPSTPPRNRQPAISPANPINSGNVLPVDQSNKQTAFLSQPSTASHPSTSSSSSVSSTPQGEEWKVPASQPVKQVQIPSVTENVAKQPVNQSSKSPVASRSSVSSQSSPSTSNSHHSSPGTNNKQSNKQASKPVKNNTSQKHSNNPPANRSNNQATERPSTASSHEAKQAISHEELEDDFDYENFPDEESDYQSAPSSSWTEVVGKHAKPSAHVVPPSATHSSDEQSGTVTAATWPAMMARIRKKPSSKSETVRLIKELCSLSSDVQSNLRFLSSYDAVGIAVYLHGHLDNKDLFPYVQPIVSRLMLLYGSHFEAFVIKKCRSVCESIIKKQPRESELYQLAYRLLWLLPDHERDLQDLMDSADLEINSINFVNRSTEDVHQLLSNLDHFPACTFLDLSQNTLSDSICKRLSDGLRAVPNLRQLLLSSNHVSDAWCKTLAPGLAHVKLLSQLVLTRNSIGSAGSKSLASYFSQVPNLNQLVLSGNSIGDAGCVAIAQNLKYLPNMNHLVLSSNKLGPAAAKALADNIKHCPHLSQLALSHNRITDEGARYLSGCFKHMPSLIQLALATNSIGDTGIRALADNFKQLPSLRQLDMSGNLFGESGIRVFSQNLKHVPQMSQLKLSENPLGDRGAMILSDYMRYLPLLQLLDLRSCKVSDAVERQFNEKVAQTHVGGQDQLPLCKFKKS